MLDSNQRADEIMQTIADVGSNVDASEVMDALVQINQATDILSHQRELLISQIITAYSDSQDEWSDPDDTWED